jgi:AraC-like DNA-binding protein
MTNSIESFVVDQNIRLYKSRLETEAHPDKRRVLLQLLEKELDRLPEALKRAEEIGAKRYHSSAPDIAMPNSPLSRYPVIRTSRVDEFESQLFAVYGASGFDLPHPENLKVRGNFVQLHEIALGFGACGTLTKIKFVESDFARLQLPLRGHGKTICGKQATPVAVGQPSLTSAGCVTELEYGEDFENLFLRVRSEALERKLAFLLGAPPRRKLEFELAEFTDQEMVSGLQRLIELLVHQLDDRQSLLSPLALRELEQAVIVQLLFATRHNLSRQLQQEPQNGSLDHVRRAEEFIEANWNRPITIELLAKVTAVGARTLFRSFERGRGYAPMMFVKKIRLERARGSLSKPDAATSVTGVAFSCGFSNLGHFARDYRNAFGELPSQTLKRSSGCT